jgi:hypothetical protein
VCTPLSRMNHLLTTPHSQRVELPRHHRHVLRLRSHGHRLRRLRVEVCGRDFDPPTSLLQEPFPGRSLPRGAVFLLVLPSHVSLLTGFAGVHANVRDAGRYLLPSYLLPSHPGSRRDQEWSPHPVRSLLTKLTAHKLIMLSKVRSCYQSLWRRVLVEDLFLTLDDTGLGSLEGALVPLPSLRARGS